MFEGDAGIWIANPDGSFPTRISETGVGPGGQDLRAAVSPQGDRIALSVFGKTGIDLVMIEIPGGRSKVLSRLLNITRGGLIFNSLTPEAFAYYAITGYPGLAWRPGSGDLLAYVGASDGPTADIYALNRETGEAYSLDDDPAQAIDPVWSPDGQFLLYFGINWIPPFGATYVTFDPMADFRAIRLADKRMILQPKPQGTNRNFAGWRDGSHYWIFDSDKKCAAHNLRLVDVTTGEFQPAADFCLYARPAVSPENGSIMISVGADCECTIGEGVFLILPGSLDPVRLTDKKALEVFWLPDSKMFYAYPEGLFSADGGARYDPPTDGIAYHPAVSVSGRQAWEVIRGHDSRVVVRKADGTWQTVVEGSIGAMLWDGGSGDTLLIAMENGSLYAAAAPDFFPQLRGTLDGVIRQAAWISDRGLP